MTKSSNSIDLHLHPKQSAAYTSEATEILYGGAAGGGKSHLMRVVAMTYCLAIPGLQVYLFRRVSDDLLRNHMEGDGGFYSLLGSLLASGKATFNAAKNVIRFSNGSKIWLCHCQYEKDVFKYQGAEIHLLLIDELTHFTEKQYRFLRSRLRTGTLKIPTAFRGKLPMALSGSNPGSAGHNWVKATFVTNAPAMHIVRMPKDEGGMLRQFIPARLDDNPSLDREEYEGKLMGLGRPELVRAMLDGDWNIVAGGALDDVWVPDIHILPRFAIPANWRCFRSFDWGSSQPFSTGFWALASGEEIERPAYTAAQAALMKNPREAMNQTRVFCPQKGSLIRVAEWYGTKKIGSNEGLKLSARLVAKGIVERQDRLKAGYWVRGEIHAGPADNSIFNTAEKESGSIAKLMYSEGITWTRCNKSSGSRVTGLQYVRDYLDNALKGEGPGLYFMDNCLAAISTLPVLPRDPKDQEDVDSKAEDHPYDEVRYTVAEQEEPIADNIPITFPT